jgi:peptidyl-prolyl cis-trans isomerase C
MKTKKELKMGKKLRLITLALCFICSLAFAEDAAAPAEEKDAKTKVEAGTNETQPAKMQMPEMPPLDPKVWDFLPETVAVVGDREISKQELIKILGPQVKMLLAMGQKLQPQQYQLLAKNMTDELVKATMLEKLAADAGYKVTPEKEEEIYKKFTEKFKKQLPEGQDINFADIIKKQGLNLEDVKKQLAKGEVVQEWITQKIAPEVKVDDAAAEKFYEENKDRYFKSPETVTASHILIKPKEDTPEGEKEAKAEAEKVYKEVQDGGDFAELAKKYSQGPSAKNGGELGKFAKGQMVPEFEAACWKLVKDNKINGVDLVKTKFGWHIIKVTAYDPGGYVKLDKQLLGQIKEQLQQQKVMEKVKELIDQETEKLKPVINIKVEAAPEAEATPQAEAAPETD